MVVATPPVRRMSPRRCRACGALGHDIRKCPKTAEALETAGPTDPIVRAAVIRERIDALEIETREYERLRVRVEERLGANAIALVRLRQELVQVRKERR